MDRTKRFLEVLVVILVLITGILLFKWEGAKQDVVLARTAVLEVEGRRSRTADFFAHFVSSILVKQSNIDFEERLKLESEARAIVSAGILARWQAFTSSKTEADAQEAVVELLSAIAEELGGKVK